MHPCKALELQAVLFGQLRLKRCELGNLFVGVMLAQSLVLQSHNEKATSPMLLAVFLLVDKDAPESSVQIIGFGWFASSVCFHKTLWHFLSHSLLSYPRVWTNELSILPDSYIAHPICSISVLHHTKLNGFWSGKTSICMVAQRSQCTAKKTCKETSSFSWGMCWSGDDLCTV